jgi:quinol monooxygenase YgiN
MLKVGLLVSLEAKPGKEAELAQFLTGALPLANDEQATLVWYALRTGPRTFAIYDGFADDAGRNAHIEGRIADALRARAGELLASPPDIKKVEILAAKPG